MLEKHYIIVKTLLSEILGFLKINHYCSMAFLVFGYLLANLSASDHDRSILWEAELNDFSQFSYAKALGKMWADFEAVKGQSIVPGKHKKIALRISCEAGIGLCTPHPLVKAVIEQLEKKGWQKEQITIIGQKGQDLRESHYLPHLGSGKSALFYGVSVVALDDGEFWDKNWFYSSSLPVRNYNFGSVIFDFEQSDIEDKKRYSWLPSNLLTDVDFWINLPVLMDQSTLGVQGAVLNGSLLQVSHNSRFLESEHEGPVAAVEIAMIPELQRSWVLTIASLEKYQFIGGPFFNAHYSASDPKLWLSSNPLLPDYEIWKRFNKHRAERELPMIPTPAIFPMGEQIGLGKYEPSEIRSL